MARFVAVSAGGVKGSGTKPAAKVRLGGRVVEVKPGEIRKGIEIPCEVYRTGPTTVRITNTTGSVLKIGGVSIEPSKSLVPNAQVWTKVG